MNHENALSKGGQAYKGSYERLALKGSKEHKQRLREELILAANKCSICPREMVNGKLLGMGFVRTKEGEMRLCVCQRSIKMLNGVEPDDLEYLFNDFEFGAKNQTNWQRPS